MAISRNMIMGLSVEMINPPIAVTGRLIQITRSPPSHRCPAHVAANQDYNNGGHRLYDRAKARTPNSWAPKIDVERPISQAIIGGLVK